MGPARRGVGWRHARGARHSAFSRETSSDSTRDHLRPNAGALSSHQNCELCARHPTHGEQNFRKPHQLQNLFGLGGRRAGDVGKKQLVMVRESAIEQRSTLWGAKIVFHREGKGGGIGMPMLLTDLLLFSVLAAWVTGMVIAIASLLS